MVAIVSTITSTMIGVVFLSSISLPTVVSQNDPKPEVSLVVTPEYKLCRVLYLDIRSLKNHSDELILLLSSSKSQTNFHSFY